MAKADYIHKPSAYESEIHPSHKTSFYALCISRLHRAEYARVGLLCRIRQWVRKRMPKYSLTIAKKRYHFSKKGGNAYCKKFIYTDVEAAKCERQN